FWVRGVQLLTMAILARLLRPEDFGLVGMVVVVVNLAQILTELGMGEALIQRDDMDEAHMSTAFWSTVVMGLAVFLLLNALAGAIAGFYAQPALRPIVRVVALLFLISPWGAVHRALLRRDLKLRKLTMVEASASVVSAVVAILMAWAGFGVWSLVGRNLALGLATVVGLWWVMRWRPRLQWRRDRFRQLFGFSANVLGARFVGYLNTNLDYLIIGKFIGAAELGIYTMAFTLARMPRRYLADIVNAVAFPAFSRAGRERVGRAYLKTVSRTALIALPVVAVVSVLAPELVAVVLGAKWQDAVLPLQLLTAASAVGTMATLSRSVFLSSGRADIQMRWQVFLLLTLVPTLAIGARWGINGIAAALALRALLMWPLQQAIVKRLAGVRWRDYLAAIRPGLTLFLLIYLLLALLRFSNSAWVHATPILYLSVAAAMTAICGFLGIRLLAPGLLEDVLLLLPGPWAARLHFLRPPRGHKLP
ncbi:MAG: colanic acid exporter, partial [Caldilineae bacterium]